MLTTAQLDRIEGDALALITAGDDAELDHERLVAVAGSVPQLIAEVRTARSEERAAEHRALESALDGDAHAVTALLVGLGIDRLRALAHAAQFTATAAHNRALAVAMAGRIEELD